MNAPERTVSFLLDEDTGETKIVYTSDTKVSSILLACNAIETSLFAIDFLGKYNSSLYTQNHFLLIAV